MCRRQARNAAQQTQKLVGTLISSLLLPESAGLMFVFEAQFDLRRRQMSEHKDGPPVAPPRSVLSLDPVALKWRNLADRRRAHLVDLYLTGRWKRYYSEEQFLACFRETMSMADRWNEIAPKSDNDNAKAGS